jgi:uncharacterized protein (UPF0332 family)
MSFNWSTYIDLAKVLNAMPEESARRSAVSRAYYSAFHVASSTLKTNGIQTFPRDLKKSHAKIWNVYKKSTKRNCRRIGVRAGNLMDDRLEADYNAARNFDAAEVTMLITEVENLVVAIGAPANVPEGFIGRLPAPVAPSNSPLVRMVRAVKRALCS